MEYTVMFLIGIIGFLISYLIKLPTAALLGPLIFIIISNFSGLNFPNFPNWLYFILQATLGAFIGFSVNRENIKQIKKLMLPSSLMMIWTFTITFGLGFLMIKIEDIDKFTAFLSTSPAGVTEMTVLAFSVEADIAIVTLFQLSRLILTISIVPFIVKKYSEKLKQTSYFDDVKIRFAFARSIILNYKLEKKNFSFSNFNYIITIFIALSGGLIGKYLGIPGGALIGSFLIISFISILGINLPIIPRIYKTIILIGVGISIGVNITKNNNFSINNYLGILLLFIIIMYATAYFMSKLIKKITDWDELSCILAAVPAGITPITIIAYENECRVLEISIIHLVRLLTVKLIIWPIILFII